MKSSRPLAYCILGLAFVVARAQSSADRFKERLDPLIEQAVREQHVPGVAVSIVYGGRVVYARGAGLRTLGHPDRPVTPDTLFHMASVTKLFVATSVMQLVEQGKVDLDAPVTKYLPYFRLNDPRYRLITVRQMVTHTSGMPDVEDYEWNRPQYDDGALEGYVRSLETKKLLFDPGARMTYSNMAFEVLGDLVAKVSGTTFEDYVDAHILRPLGMSSSTLLIKRADPAKLADGYTRSGKNDDPLRSVDAYPYNRIHTPSSNLDSSVADMARWAMANLNRGELDGKRILKSATYDLMWKPAAEVQICRGPDRTECRKTGANIGISWFLEEKDGQQIVSHGGGDDGFMSSLVLVPGLKFGFVMMSNSDFAGIALLKQVQREALRIAQEQAATAAPSSPTPARLR